MVQHLFHHLIFIIGIRILEIYAPAFWNCLIAISIVNTTNLQTDSPKKLSPLLPDEVNTLNLLMDIWSHMTWLYSFESCVGAHSPLIDAPCFILYGADSFRLLFYTLVFTIDMVLVVALLMGSVCGWCPCPLCTCCVVSVAHDV